MVDCSSYICTTGTATCSSAAMHGSSSPLIRGLSERSGAHSVGPEPLTSIPLR